MTRSARAAVTTLVCVVTVGAAWAAAALTLATSRPGQVAIALVVSAYCLVGGVIVLARAGSRVGGAILVGAGSWAAGELALACALTGSGPLDPGVAAALGTASRGSGWLVLVLVVPAYFPDDAPPVHLRRLPQIAWACAAMSGLSNLVAPSPLDDRLAGVDNPTGLPHDWQLGADLLALGAVGLAFVVLLLVLRSLWQRWRTHEQLVRQQLTWLLAAFVPPVVLLPLTPVLSLEPGAFALVTLPVPVAIGVAMLQRRLYDVQLVASRTLTYAALSLTLAATYAVVVAGVGAMLRDRADSWLPWAATGVVAVAFAPVRDAVQRAVNRLTYGRWSAPAEVLADVGHRLSGAADVPALLDETVGDMVNGLGLAHAEIVDGHGEVLARHGESTAAVESLPLTAYGAQVGTLRWSGAQLRGADRALLGDLARQLGGVVHTAGLVEDLRRASEEVVLAAEQERRRLRRDLHDGLGPALAGLGMVTDKIGNRLAQGEDIETDLTALRAGLRGTVADVRRLVEGLRPPSVDDLGLRGALGELAGALAVGAGLELDLDLPDEEPALPAAVEVAAYRVAQEALTNVVRHAGATRLRLGLQVAGSQLRLQVVDDGRGLGATPATRGVGMGSMSERAREIGGRVDVSTATPSGTAVTLTLPLREEKVP